MTGDQESSLEFLALIFLYFYFQFISMQINALVDEFDFVLRITIRIWFCLGFYTYVTTGFRHGWRVRLQQSKSCQYKKVFLRLLLQFLLCFLWIIFKALTYSVMKLIHKQNEKWSCITHNINVLIYLTLCSINVQNFTVGLSAIVHIQVLAISTTQNFGPTWLPLVLYM